jgi:quinol monooxygenase YgiN
VACGLVSDDSSHRLYGAAMGRRQWKRHYEEPDASLLRVVRVRTCTGKRNEFVKVLADAAKIDVMNRVVVWSVDADEDDQLYLLEYWSDLVEYGNGTHAESDVRFSNATKGLIESETVVLEADPVWAQGLCLPAGVELSLGEANH